MQDLFKELEKEATANLPENVPVEDVCLVLIIDYAHNLEMPLFWENQPVHIT